jgi:hypothetical protein
LEQKESRPNTQASFREWTEQLLANFENEKEHIHLNILDSVLNQSDFKPDKIIIVVSNQEDEVHNSQDTLFEGEIIKKILQEKYNIAESEVELKELTKDVTNENYLMLFYQKLYQELLHNYKDANFVFCDAGGTGQQKTSCKLMAEFMFSDKQWKILYPKKDGSIEEKTQIEYRNIISKEQAIALVRKSQYEAALNILGGNVNDTDENQVFNLLAFAHFRISCVSQKTEKLWQIKQLPERKNQIIQSACFPKKLNYSETMLNLFSEKTYLMLSELLYVSYHYCLSGNYRDSILTFAVFYESFIDKCLKLFDNEIKKIFHGKVNKKSGELTELYLKSNELLFPATVKYAKEATQISDKDADYKSVPLAIHLVAEQDTIPELCKLGNLLMPYLDFSKRDYNMDKQEENSIRSVRNKLAHEGVYISKEEMNKRLPYYQCLLESCLDCWGLKLNDIYEEMNILIEEQIREKL